MNFISIFLISVFCSNLTISRLILEPKRNNKFITNKHLTIFVEEKKNIAQNKNENNGNLEKEKDILEKIKAIQNFDNETNYLINYIKSKMDFINDKQMILNDSFSNIKNVLNISNEEEENSSYSYSLKPKLFLCLIIFLAMTIYIIELKYEKNKDENNENINSMERYNYKTYNNQNSTKLYLSL